MLAVAERIKRQLPLLSSTTPSPLGAIKAILEAGPRLPRDIAAIGSGNVRYSDLLQVPLSSIDQDIAAIGDHATKLAPSPIDAKCPVRPESILVQPKLVAQDSSTPVDAAQRSTLH